MSSPEEFARRIVQHLQRSQREPVRHRQEARRVDAPEWIDQSAQLDRVSRVCIPTIQRLYSMLRFLFFWDRNTEAARRDQREETGSASCAIDEACGMLSFGALASQECAIAQRA
jgi:hypothetical protein